MIRKAHAVELIKELNVTDETEDLEAKEVGSSLVGKSVYETICALSNEPGLEGGTILLGVEREVALFTLYRPAGVTDPDKLSGDISSACATMFNQSVRVDIKTEKVGNATILRIDVPELPHNQKPLYFKATGLPRGAFRRIGAADVKCSDEDLQAFFQGKVSDPIDGRVLLDATIDDLDTASIVAYRKARSDANPIAEELNWSDEEMLHSLGALKRVNGQYQITVAGLLTFGKASALRRLAPAQRVDYIRVPGRHWVSDPDARFDSLDMRGSLVTLIGRVIAAIVDDLPKTLVFDEGVTGQRKETPVLPLRVLREAVVNSLMHRAYDVSQPVQVIRYANRIVIRNPGYSLKSQERFDEPGSAIRNPTIAEILHETRFAETKGSGIRVMQQKMKQRGLAAPTFESDRDGHEFRATFLFHHFLDEKDWQWLSRFTKFNLTQDQMKALIFVREVQAIDNATYRSLTQLDTLSASKSLRALVQSKLLKDKGSGAKTFYVAGHEMALREIPYDEPTIHANAPSMDGSAAKMDANAATPPPRRSRESSLALVGGRHVELADLPTQLRYAVRSLALKKRVPPEELTSMIARLCDWKALSATEIAGYLGKKHNYISQRFIAPMVSQGLIRYKYPEMPQHPEQKYLSPRLSDMQGSSRR
ncbi:putative DNA binding domain-containing protein [Sphingomonas sp. NY01]|uniref:ATP-binding protein n=1 Tax=Sphingomonas sp. NY01 TaxID=2968057 RepID=UPI00315D4583